MLRKRIIFTLVVDQNFFMQSRNFRLQRVGDIHWLEKHYQFQKTSFSIDELIILNASRQKQSLVEFAKIVERLSSQLFIPIAAGGGIQTLEDAALLFVHGADKIVLNTLLHQNPLQVQKMVKKYGSQSIIASIDYKRENNSEVIYIANGLQSLDQSLLFYIQYVEELAVGEIYLNSITQDGTGFGYDLDIVNKIRKEIHVPLIIAGGAGNEKHLYEGISSEYVSAIATANLFNFMGDGLPKAREFLLNRGINIAKWHHQNNLATP